MSKSEIDVSGCMSINEKSNADKRYLEDLRYKESGDSRTSQEAQCIVTTYYTKRARPCMYVPHDSARMGREGSCRFRHQPRTDHLKGS